MRRGLEAVLALALTATSGAAKDDYGSWQTLSQLKAGSKVEVVETNLKSTRGALVSISEGSIVVKVKRSDVTVERAMVMRVSVRDTSKRSRNMLIGALAGAGAGLAITMPKEIISSNEGNSAARLVAGVTAGAAAAGLGLGASTGNRTVYRAPKAESSNLP